MLIGRWIWIEFDGFNTLPGIDLLQTQLIKQHIQQTRRHIRRFNTLPGIDLLQTITGMAGLGQDLYIVLIPFRVLTFFRPTQAQRTSLQRHQGSRF